MRLYQESIDGLREQHSPQTTSAETQKLSPDFPQRQATPITEQFQKTREDFGDIIRGSYSGI